MLRSLKLIFLILQLGVYTPVIYSNPVTNYNSGATKSDTFVFELPKVHDAQSLSSRVASLSASGQSYGDTTNQKQAPNKSSAANGRILSQATITNPDAITYPDDIIRDSYGNIVTPYTTLVEHNNAEHTSEPTEIGVLTDVNRDKGHQNTLQFVIPSYSNGILTEINPVKPSNIGSPIAPPLQTLLPPLSSGNYNYPSLGSAIKPPVDNSYQNEISGSFPLSTPGIGPSAANNVYTPNLQQPLNSAPAFSGPAPLAVFANVASLANNQQGVPAKGTSDFSAIQVSSTATNVPSSTFPIITNTKPQKDIKIGNQIPVQIQVDSGKYTGGFGGAPGILGEQKTPGYAIKPTSSKIPLTPSIPQTNSNYPASNSIPVQNSGFHQGVQNSGFHQGVQNSGFHQGVQNTLHSAPASAPPSAPAKPIQGSNANHGSFQFGSSVSLTGSDSQFSNSGKYTGGFGGPPGILAPYDNLKASKALGTENRSSSNAGSKRKY